MLERNKISLEVYNSIQEFFEFLGQKAHIPIKKLWENFWKSDLNAIELSQSIFYSETKQRFNIYKRLNQYLLNRQVIIKMADKNAGITLMTKNWYMQKAEAHLKCTTTYQPFKNSFFNPEQKILEELDNLCKKHKQKTITWYNPIKNRIATPQFYIMPKVHKTPIGVRPIIPSHSWYTTHAAKWLHKKLLPLVKNYKHVIMDRLELIQDLEQRRFTKINKPPYIATIDVTALYTAIDLDKGLEIIRRVLNKNKTLNSETEFIIDLLNWVLRNNFFQFNGIFYQQIKGAAMGGNVSGIFADLILAVVELNLLNKLPENQQPLYYRRYRDDIILITKSIKHAHAIEKMLNSPNFLQFNLEQIGTSVNYLDLTIFLGERWKKKKQMDIKPYTKPTTNGNYTHYASYKPEKTKNSWITGETIRILRAAQCPKQYYKNIKKLKKSLSKAEYPQNVIRTHIKYKFEDRKWLIEKQPETDSIWYKMNTGRMAHEQWNFIQNNFKPLLKMAGIQITAPSGKNTMDAINSINKKILNPTPTEIIERRDKNYLNKNIKRKPKKMVDNSTETSKELEKPVMSPKIMRKRTRNEKPIHTRNTEEQISNKSYPTDSSKIPIQYKNTNKYIYIKRGRHGRIEKVLDDGQPTRRPDEAKSETRSHGMTKSKKVRVSNPFNI